jgi:hypothetical protein
LLNGINQSAKKTSTQNKRYVSLITRLNLNLIRNQTVRQTNLNLNQDEASNKIAEKQKKEGSLRDAKYF